MTDKVLQGERIYGVDKKRDGHLWFAPRPGTYWFDNSWWAATPNGLIAALSNHTVTEHEDGTITVFPSILCEGETSWHGYLEGGVWHEV